MTSRSKRGESDHIDRSKRVETDVNVYRLRIGVADGGAVVFGWDYPGSTLLRVRIVRTEVGDEVAGPGDKVTELGGSDWALQRPEAEPRADSPWHVVYDGDTGSFRDAGVASERAYRYVVYARDGDGPWTLWRVHEVRPT